MLMRSDARDGSVWEKGGAAVRWQGIPRAMQLTTALAVVVVVVGVAVLTAGCGGSKQAAPETALLSNAVTRLESTELLEKKCEKLFGALSRSLDAKQITTTATLKSRQGQVRACFASVQAQTRTAMTPLRKILRLSGVSEWKSGQSKYSADEVSKMPGAVAAAYVITHGINGLNQQVGRAVILVEDARLGVPLGAGPLHDITGEEPVQTVNTLLFLGKYRALVARNVGLARTVLENSAN